MVSPVQWAFLPLEKFFQFHGRSPRAEYWWFWVLCLGLGVITGLFDELAGLNDPAAPFTLTTPVSFALLIPSLAVTVRRLHDINKSGWVMLGYFIALYVPFILVFLTPVGWILLFTLGETIVWIAIGAMLITAVKFALLMATDGSPGDNLYGPNPYGLQYGY